MERRAERRQQKREPLERIIEFSVSVVDRTLPGSSDVKAMGVDISDRGLGIVTEFPLEKEQVLLFHRTIRGHRVGVVEWSTACEGGCRSGICFK